LSPTRNQRLAYRDAFKGHHNQAFQTWFESLARVLHPPGDFQPIRTTSGDGGLDGLAIDSQLVYQVFAPARMEELRDGETAAKIRSDFLKAYSTLKGCLKTWVFVHNHPEGKIGQLTAAAMSALKNEHPAITFRILDIESLWEELARLPDETLESLFGTAEPKMIEEEALPPDLKQCLDDADTLVAQGRYREGSREARRGATDCRSDKRCRGCSSHRSRRDPALRAIRSCRSA
jgi:hypothetical protein